MGKPSGRIAALVEQQTRYLMLVMNARRASGDVPAACGSLPSVCVDDAPGAHQDTGGRLPARWVRDLSFLTAIPVQKGSVRLGDPLGEAVVAPVLRDITFAGGAHFLAARRVAKQSQHRLCKRRCIEVDT